MIHKDTHVYCTHCKHFRLDDEDKPYCPFEDECDIWDCEDSKPYEQRPIYEKDNINQPFCVIERSNIQMNDNEYDKENDDYIDSDYPCNNCSSADTCDGWEAQVCPTLNNYYGIEDYDPWDI